MGNQAQATRWATASDGLCLTCNNAPHCQYRATRGNALFFCEMFDIYAEPVRRGNGNRLSLTSNPTSPLTGYTQAPPAHAGLCVNCMHLEQCMHSRPTGGVWHCEDYE